MKNYDLEDSIAAIATPIGESGIGIVRISGKGALPIADKIFISKDGSKPSGCKAYTTHYGWIISNHRSPAAGHQLSVKDRQVEIEKQKQNIVDEVILTVMRAPKSYTRQDVVEINCHGGIAALRRTLDLVLENGCRLAEPGEFSRRAFLNGRIDLVQAEAVLDIIKAKTDSALKVGMEQLKGGLSKELNRIRGRLLDMLTLLEASIDFPEEETDRADINNFSRELEIINNGLKHILATAKEGRIFREGINVVICGRPNVGKSSLLNALLKQERSIVTAIPGTTRDTIEEIIDIKGIPVRIVDTAGIIEPRNLIERKAVKRSKRHMDFADLVILLFDNSKELNRQDKILIKKLKKKAVVAVINKIDLKAKIQKDKLIKAFRYLVEVSAKKKMNIGVLEETIVDLVYRGKVKSSESALISNLRHIELIKRADKLVAEAKQSMDNKLSLEFIAQNAKDALGYLDDILGKRFSEELLDKIFSEFCIGK